jgi:aspartate racemase
MKKAGIIGGIAPESTIQYYRLIISGYRERVKDGSYPSIIIDSIDMKKMLDLVGAGNMAGLVDYLAGEIDWLKRAGADFCLLASNTPHIAFEALQSRASLPLISIVEATSAAAQSLGLKRVGLFGTAFTMQGRFYPDVLSRAGISVAVPSPSQQEYIHDKYMNELVNGIFLPETRDRLLEIAEELRVNEGIEGLILGGTELPLILNDTGKCAIPFLDTTRIHVESALIRMISCLPVE